MADGPLAGLRVIDAATLFAGPLADDVVSSWIGARSTPAVIAAFERAEAAVGPVYDLRGVLADSQYDAIGAITTIDDDELRPIKMQNVLFRMSESPGSIRWTGRPHGADTDAVMSELGYTDDEIAGLRARGAA